MIIDARTLPDDHLIEADLCIVGAGAAGITLATECARQSFRVCLLESGGLAYEADTQALYKGQNTGFPISLDLMRLRYFGGSTNHWGHYCRPLDAIDFEARDWVPHSGWPFDKAALDPYYQRAQAVCQLSPFDYELKTWETARARALPLAAKRVQTSIFQVRQPPTRFGSVYRDTLEQASNLTTLLHANVVSIDTTLTAQTITRMRVATLQGNALRVKAKWFVLATGAIENARLLLLPNPVQQTGLGNQHDLVGRYFTGHPMLDAAIFLPSNPVLPTTLYYEKRPLDQVSGIGHLTLAPAILRDQRLLNINVALVPVFENQRSVISLRRLLHGQFHQLINDVRDVITDLDGVATAVYHKMVDGVMPVELFKLTSVMEQVPNPQSRVTLVSKRDALGKPCVQLDWQLSEADIRSTTRAFEIIGAELGRAGLGRVQLTLDESPDKWRLESGGHHIGTTRMHDNPRAGVVDANCRVHGVSNLFVAGSSVFPTAGHANPTLTIVALAVRLADHLKSLVTS